VEIHPETAAARGIADGDEVMIRTRYGEIAQTARVTENIHPRVVSADLGWWFPEGDPAAQYDWQRSNFNMLTSVERLGKEFGTPNIANLPCTVEKR